MKEFIDEQGDLLQDYALELRNQDLRSEGQSHSPLLTANPTP